MHIRGAGIECVKQVINIRISNDFGTNRRSLKKAILLATDHSVLQSKVFVFFQTNHFLYLICHINTLFIVIKLFEIKVNTVTRLGLWKIATI